MQITIFSGFSKEHNSTKQPVGGTIVQCYLKDETSLVHPVFVLTGASFSTNYVQWGNRYYFVDDVVSIRNGAVELHCSIDALASWKADIGASTQYVTRSASSYNGRIPDKLYPCLAGESVTVSTLTEIDTAFSGGSYVVGVVGDNVGESGITYYSFSGSLVSSFGDLVSYLFQGNTLDAPVTEISLELQKELVNPFQYIVSCMWYPFDIGGANQAVKVGYWTATGVNGFAISDANRIKPFTSAFSLPRHPQQPSLGAFVNASPYTEHMLHVYSFPDMPIPSEIFVQGSTGHVNIYVDIYSGIALLTVTNDEGYTFIRSFGQIGVPVQLSGINASFLATAMTSLSNSALDYFSQFDSMVGASGDAKAGFGVASAIGNGAMQKSARVVTQGSQGTKAAFEYPPRIITSFKEVVNIDPEHNGRPLMQKVMISSLSGFVQVENPDVELPATSAEKDIIAGYMRSGFYYE